MPTRVVRSEVGGRAATEAVPLSAAHGSCALYLLVLCQGFAPEMLDGSSALVDSELSGLKALHV